MFTIRQTEDGRCEVVDADGTVVFTGTPAEAMAEVEGRLATLAEDGDAPEAARAFEAWLAPLDTETSDGRRLASDGFETREMPLPLMWQTETQIGHDGAVLAGRIDEVWVEGGWLRGRGQFDDTEEGRGAVEDLENRITDDRPAGWFGISIDPAVHAVDFECMEEDEDGFCVAGLETYTEWELMGATGTPFPAFAEAGITLAEPRDDDEDDGAGEGAAANPVVQALSLDDAQAANVAEAIGEARSQAEAAVGALADDPDDDDLSTARDALGTVIEECDAALGMIGDAEDDDEDDGESSASARLREGDETGSESLVASAVPDAPPAEWFADPGLDEPTPLTVTDDGRVYGHLATWGTCHIGREDVCLTPPDSPSGYAYYRTGETLAACEPCDDGETLAPVPTGTITLGTGHADLAARPRTAMEHYDNTGTAVADVAAGEDEHGIWVAGAIRRGVTDDQVAALRASSLSGDWRRIGGSLELVAALAVNVPGFPIPRAVAASGAPPALRPRAHAHDGRQTALVAAGPVRRSPEEEESLGRHPVGLSEEERRSLRRVERALAPQYARALRAEVHGDGDEDNDEPPVEPISLEATRAMRARRASAG